MPARQTIDQKRRREAHICKNCSAPTWSAGRCFRHTVILRFHKAGLTYYRGRQKRAFEYFVNGLSARYTRILEDEGFAVDAISEPEKMIELSGMTWARGRLKKKVLAIIARFDDDAIRRRFS